MTFNEDVLRRTEKAGFQFFITDLELAITLAQIASDAQEDSEKRERNRSNAREAYDTIRRISSHAVLTDEQREQVNDKLEVLRSALEKLGEVFT